MGLVEACSFGAVQVSQVGGPFASLLAGLSLCSSIALPAVVGVVRVACRHNIGLPSGASCKQKAVSDVQHGCTAASGAEIYELICVLLAEALPAPVLLRGPKDSLYKLLLT